MAREWYPTVAQVVSAAARGLGLVSADIADPFASTNPAVLQMCQLLTDLGQDLARDYDWQQLRGLETIDLSGIPSGGMAAAIGHYTPLPAGLGHIHHETVWDITNDSPLVGPLGNEQWAALVNSTSANTTPRHWRVFNDLFGVFITSTVSVEVTFTYASRYWVGEAADEGPYFSDSDLILAATSDAADEASDRLHFDKRLLVEGLKLRFAEAKGMPSDGHRRNYEDALNRAMSNNEPGRTRSLNSPTWPPTPRLPDSGSWGS